MLPIGGQRNILLHKLAVWPQFLRCGYAPGLIYIANNDHRALGNKSLSNTIANTSGTTCDYGALALQFLLSHKLTP
jgi:hypothetical protein